jgi:CheY-like chemotaxis protein
MNNKPVIVYADDDPDDREMFREYLLMQSSEYELVEVANGREVLLYLRSTKGLKNPPVLTVLDLNMPVLTGRETLAIMKSEKDTENLPVVVFTTSTSAHDDEFCRKFGIRMITKPATVPEIEDTVKELLTFITNESLLAKNLNSSHSIG